MRLQFCSDLHQNEYKHILEIPVCAPNLALIGDIGIAHTSQLYQFLDTLSSDFERVFFIPGNHEYYENTIDHTETFLQDLCHDLDIEYLQCKTTEIDDIMIHGCTLWSHPSPHGFHKTNDKNWIKNFDREAMIQEHKKHVSFLETSLQKNKEKPHVVLTHYAPLMEMNGIWQGRENTCMFATDLSYLFQAPVKYWLCGHVHQNLTHIYQGIPCISNCFGSPEEVALKESFEITKTIEV